MTATQLDMLMSMKNVYNSKFKEIFSIMPKYYIKYLQLFETIYDEEESVKKEITIKYIFHITILYDEILKNLYSNNRISVYILARTLIESSVKFIFIQRNNSEISEMLKDSEDVIAGKFKLKHFNEKYRENTKYISDNFGLDICLKKIGFKTYKKGLSAIIEFIISKEGDYEILLKHYKKFCKNIHVNLDTIQCNVCNYQKANKDEYNYMLNIILLLNYTLYNVIYELYNGQYRNCIKYEEFKKFDRQYRYMIKILIK